MTKYSGAINILDMSKDDETEVTNFDTDSALDLMSWTIASIEYYRSKLQLEKDFTSMIIITCCLGGMDYNVIQLTLNLDGSVKVHEM